MCAPEHRRPQRPQRPPAHPPPPLPRPSPHHTNSASPTPRGLRTLRHHRGLACHRAPDKSVPPNRRHNDTHHSTTRPQGSRDTGRHLPGAEPYQAQRVQGRWAPPPNNPLALHTRIGCRPQAPQEARNPKHHLARPHTVGSQQPARRQQHKPTRSHAHAMAHLTGRQRAQHTRRPKTPPRRHMPLPRPTPPPPGPPTPCAPTPTTPPRARTPRLRRHHRGTYQPRHTPNRRPSDTTRHQPGRRYGPQNRHLPFARPPAWTPAQIWHAPPSRLTPSSPQAREANPGRRPCQKATPERRRNRQTMQPRRPHRQRNRNTGAEEMQKPPQQRAPPAPVGEPSGGADQPAIPHAVPPNMAAHGSSEASTAGQPDTEREEPMPDTECEDGLRPPSAHGPEPAGRAGAAPLANPAHHAAAGAPGVTRPRDPPETSAASETLITTPDTPQRAAGRGT